MASNTPTDRSVSTQTENTPVTKKPYQRPQLKSHGQISVVTLATSADFGGGGGFGP